MKNTIETTQVGPNLYVTLSVNSNRIGLFLVAVFILGYFGFAISGFFVLDQDEMKGYVSVFLLFTVIMILMPIRYFLWNKFGKEHLIINTMTVSYQYDYGFFITRLKQKPFDRLGMRFESVRRDGEDDLGRLVFIDYPQKNPLPEPFHETTVLLTETQIDGLSNQILDLFYEEKSSESGFIPFSMN